MYWNRASITFATLAAGTVLGLAGTDLVLPAIPGLPDVFGVSAPSAQMVIAAFVAGTATGLLLFGTASRTVGRERVIAAALLAYAALSGIAAWARDIHTLIGLRFLQGVAASAPSVFAIPILRASLDEARAIKAIGLLGSIEGAAPALAPIVGAWIVARGGWAAPFLVTAVAAALLAMALLIGRVAYPQPTRNVGSGGYRRLLSDSTFIRYAGSQACVLGGLLTFVFGAPWIIVKSLHGTIGQFVWMQVIGISCFTVAANATAHWADRIGPERTVWSGTLVAFAGAASLLIDGIWGSGNVRWLIGLFAVLNLGLGIRGPVGFFRAILAGRGDDERASSLTILFILLVAAAGTALVAPALQQGLSALAFAATVIELAAVLLLLLLPAL
jgi:MFS transporter, DHA1 family, multidrug resistance protein